MGKELQASLEDTEIRRLTAQAYSFAVENDLHELIKWATKYQFTRTD
jgi:hypothetical protein